MKSSIKDTHVIPRVKQNPPISKIPITEKKYPKIHALNPKAVTEVMVNRKGVARANRNGLRTFDVHINIKGTEMNVFVIGVKGKEVLKLQGVDEIWLSCGADEDIYDMSRPDYTGNTVLIRKGRLCWLVGSEITQYRLWENEKISAFFCTMGNNWISYGFTMTDRRVIFNTLTGCETNAYIKGASKINVKDIDEYRYCLPKTRQDLETLIEVTVSDWRDSISYKEESTPIDPSFLDKVVQRMNTAIAKFYRWLDGN